MTLLGRLFGSAVVDDLFSPANTVQCMLDFEAALALAESQVGVIPSEAAVAITSQCRVALFDLDALADGCAHAGNLAIPVVQQLSSLVTGVDQDAARFVHWGATSQDVIDTALVLQLRRALSHIAADVDQLRQAALRLANEYRATPIVARTWMQHAVPSVLGLQFAGWADALARHADRVESVRRHELVLQFGGAGGTLAALGDQGSSVSRALAVVLDLPMPMMPWHAHRDRIASMAMSLALLTGTLGKIGRDIALQSQTEVEELAEPAEPGRGVSSTMPHKRNPVGAAVALAAAVRVPALATAIVSGMVQEHERGLGGWQAEWEGVPEVVRLTSGALSHMLHAVTGLTIDAPRMLANLDVTRGLVYSEAVTLALAKHIGRSDAREVVERASRRVRTEGAHLREILGTERVVRMHLTSRDLDALFDPSRQVGASEDMIARVLSAGAPDVRAAGDA